MDPLKAKYRLEFLIYKTLQQCLFEEGTLTAKVSHSFKECNFKNEHVPSQKHYQSRMHSPRTLQLHVQLFVGHNLSDSAS